MNVFRDSPDFFKAEIERAELELTQSITGERRAQLTKQIAAARVWLADSTAILKA
jgi:hypothetical protein